MARLFPQRAFRAWYRDCSRDPLRLVAAPAVRANALLDASTLVIRRTQPSPGTKLGCGRKLFHVSPDLGQDAGGGFFLDAWNALEQMERFGKRRLFHAPLNLAIERFHLLIQELEVTKSMPDKKPLMIAQPVIGNRSCDLRDLLSCLLLGQIGDLLCGHLAIEERGKHQFAGNTEDI